MTEFGVPEWVCSRMRIGNYIDAWNERCQPFTWTKTADQILTKAAKGQRSSFTRH